MYLKNFPIRALVPCLLIMSLIPPVLAGSGQAEKDKLCRADITSLIKTYEKALNASNVQDVIKLYAQDGVFMPSTKPTSTGREQVTKAYQHVFKALDLDVKFHLDEIVRRGDMAFVRTVSDGKIKLLDKNTTLKNNSRELFVVKRIRGDWKIYRYMFNEMGQPEVL